MRKNATRFTAASLAMLVAMSGSQIPTLAGENGNNITKISSPVLITEIVPNTDNLSKLDAYEYYELTNISDKEIDLSNYHIVYVNGTKQALWDPNIQKIPAKSSMLVWIKNEGNAQSTKADFCKYYNISEEDSLIAELECDGLSNSGTRTLAITTATGKVLSQASYQAAASSEGKIDVNEAIVFSYNGDAITLKYDEIPTPLAVGENDIFGNYISAEMVSKPGVETTKITELAKNTPLEIEVTDTNMGIENIISGNIIVDEKEYPLIFNEEGKLVGSVPFADVAEKGVFSYSVSVFDGTNTAVTSEQNVIIEGTEIDKVDQSKAPALVITELLPDSANVSGADAYEFIEVYNNSDTAINLKDYKLNYLYPDTGVSVTWWEGEDRILGVGETLVFWVDNGANSELTMEDFNNKFATNLTENQLIKIESGGMANGSRRGMNITTNTGMVIDSVIYNDNADNTTADKSITYQNQYAEGIFSTVLTGDMQTPTPGAVVSSEKPVYQAKLAIPTQTPILEDKSAKEFSNDTNELVFSVKATSEDTTIKSVKLFLKYNDQTNFESYNLILGDNDTYTKQLNNVDLLNKRSFTYYFSVSDGFSTVTTDELIIKNKDAAEITQLNLEDGDTVTDMQQIIAYGEKILIEGIDVTANANKSINGFGKIAFEATDTDVFFKNAVAVDGEVIGIFNEGTYSEVRTYVYDIDASKFDSQKKTITVEFHAGNKANVLEHNIENNDDFTIQNIRLVLPNGKTLTPFSYQTKKGLGTVEHNNMDHVEKVDIKIESQETPISMGDGTSKNEILYATFQLEDSDFEAIRYMWDTTQIQDGTYAISNGTEEVTVTVDNTAPEITANIEDGVVYHNGSIEVEAKDAHSEKVTTVVLLDGKAIDVPYEFRALEMEAGQHVLSITSRDEVGNVAEQVITFITPKEEAVIDEVVTPENGSTVTTSPKLSIKAVDESNDTMTVTFKTGERYELADKNITKGSGISNVSGSIEQVFEENTGNGFPYESFQIELDDSVDENAIVSIEWTGITNNTKTFMYVYNTNTDEWEKLDASQKIDGENITLCGEVSLKDHFADDCVNVIVQNGEGYTPTQYKATTQNKVNSEKEQSENEVNSEETVEFESEANPEETVEPESEAIVESESEVNPEETVESESEANPEETVESESKVNSEETVESESKVNSEETVDPESEVNTEEIVKSEGEIQVNTEDSNILEAMIEPNDTILSKTSAEDENSVNSQISKQDTVSEKIINKTDASIPTYNTDDTLRENYDFTFVIESDTQYYNEDYEGNPDKTVDGVYQHQLNIHNWILANRERMNIQYLFHNGDIVDDEPNIKEWEQASAAYNLLDKAGIAYGVLAGNHDVGHLSGSYGKYSTYFGESRYADNAWYGESYKDNRGHYDLISVGGIDFIMVYMGWGIGDEEIAWLNNVLAQYPERKAILNFHEYLLASGGLGEEPQRIHDEVVATNENVCMVFSGHYHNARTTTDTFVNEDGSTRTVYNMLFDYQGLLEGGAGYMRLMHFDLDDEKVIIRTYTPSYGGTEIDNYGDYDAKESQNPNEGNAFVVEGAQLNDSEHFEISFAELGITPSEKILETSGLNVNVYKNEVIGTVTDVESGTEASYVWENANEGINGWYAEVTDENGGLSRTNVYYVNVNRDTQAPLLTVPEDTVIQLGDDFDVMEGVFASDNTDGDLTEYVIVNGKVNTSIAGTYELTYEVTDKAGNMATTTRVVTVKDIPSDKPDEDKPSENIPSNIPNEDKPSEDIPSNKPNGDKEIENNVDKNKQEITSPKTGYVAGSSISIGLSAVLISIVAFLKKFWKKINKE